MPTLYYLELFSMVQECPSPQSDNFGAIISGATSQRPPLSPVGQVMNSTLSHSGSRWVSGGLSMPILAILYTRRRGGGEGGQFQPFYSQSQGGRLTKHKGAGSGHNGGQFAGCKVTVLQANRVGSWRCPCGFAHLDQLGF